MNYYIINTEYSNEFVTFWKPEANGYTQDWRQAGLFDQEFCDKRRHNKALVFIPAGNLCQEDTIQAVRWSKLKEKMFLQGV